MLVQQIHGPTIGMGHLGHNMSNTLPQIKGESLSLEGLECITWCGTYVARLTWQDLVSLTWH